MSLITKGMGAIIKGGAKKTIKTKSDFKLQNTLKTIQ